MNTATTTTTDIYGTPVNPDKIHTILVERETQDVSESEVDLEKMLYYAIERIAALEVKMEDCRDNHVLEDILQQSRRVRSYSNPDKVFDAVPVRAIMPESAEKQEER
jgi:hypothetical protein